MLRIAGFVMTPAATLALYSFMIVAASLFGGWVPSRIPLSHRNMQVVISFVGGLMLGIGMLHLIPHSLAETGNRDATFRAALVGLLGMFFLIRMFHFHQHGPVAESDAGHEHHNCHDASHSHYHQLNWTGVAFGLSVHTLLDGMALAAAVKVESQHGATVFGLSGVGVFFAIFCHKPLDALSITTLMQTSGWSRHVQQSVNLAFAMMCPLGAIVVYQGVELLEWKTHLVLGIILGISGGIFLCISLSDLLPELQFHRHDKAALSGSLLSGVIVAVLIGWFEPAGYHATPAAIPPGETFESGPGPANR